MLTHSYVRMYIQYTYIMCSIESYLESVMRVTVLRVDNVHVLDTEICSHIPMYVYIYSICAVQLNSKIGPVND